MILTRIIDFIHASDEEIQAIGDGVPFNALVQRQAEFEVADYNAADHFWIEPADSACPQCYRWERFPPGERHFGFAWWRQCDWVCSCTHHSKGIWIT